ncbi:MAG: hypothetical protein IKA79_09160, partial [Lentisphaeria bacterium]|nr:hypothetical protein [Lentisphaeria bacterium]
MLKKLLHFTAGLTGTFLFIFCISACIFYQWINISFGELPFEQIYFHLFYPITGGITDDAIIFMLHLYVICVLSVALSFFVFEKKIHSLFNHLAARHKNLIYIYIYIPF